jgi:DNA-binding beta-propeller fold protein YncE
MKKAFFPLVVFTVLLLLSGCASTQKHPRFVWPPPPEEPKLEWKGVYYSEADLTRGDGFQVLEGFLGEATGERFITPFGIAADSAGNVYISDIHKKNVWIYDFEQKDVKLLTRLSSFATPLGLAVDRLNNLYVADGGKGQIFVFDQNRKPLRTIKDDTLTKPAYLAINEKLGRLYASDGIGHRIAVFNLTGEHLFSFGERGNGEGQFFGPQGLAISPAGDLFVADMFNARIQVFDPEGNFKYAFGSRGDRPGQFESPKDIAFDNDGNLYLVDARRSNLEIYTTEGKLLLVVGAGRPSSSPFGFSTPRAISITADGRIYVSQALGRRFTVWQYFNQQYRAEHPFTEQDKQQLLEYMEKIQQEAR